MSVSGDVHQQAYQTGPFEVIVAVLVVGEADSKGSAVDLESMTGDGMQ